MNIKERNTQTWAGTTGPIIGTREIVTNVRVDTEEETFLDQFINFVVSYDSSIASSNASSPQSAI
jgi:hypothetical protein